jgi:CubicO group peptidase (beta-lactamase class C family)
MIRILLIFLLAISTSSFAQTQQKAIDSLFYGKAGIRVQNPDVGLVVGIYQNGQTHYYSIGTRMVKGSAVVDSLTIFEIGSATKTLTALLLAIDIQHHRLAESDPIDRYLPVDISLPRNYRNKIKLTDLASHQSGLPNLSSDKYFESLLQKDPRNPFRFVDQKYLYRMLKETDTLMNYGKYQYNNYAFSLLGDLLARKNEMTFNTLITHDILHSLEMENTTFDNNRSTNVAGLYDQRGHPQEPMILKAASPAGGLKSNAVDLIKYLKAQISGTSTLEAAIRLTQNVYYKDNERMVGLGWDIKDDYYQKDGDTFGNSCLLRFSRKNGTAIVVLSNHQNGMLVRDAVDFIYAQINQVK